MKPISFMFICFQEDNGVKLVDPMGEMLAATWESYATMLANAEQEELISALNEIIEKEGIDKSQEASVFVGKDTRYVYINQTKVEFTGNGSLICVDLLSLLAGAVVPVFHKQFWMEFMLLVVTAKVNSAQKRSVFITLFTFGFGLTNI